VIDFSATAAPPIASIRHSRPTLPAQIDDALRRVSASTPGRMAVAKAEYADLVEAIQRRSAADAVDTARQHITAARASAKIAMGLLMQDQGAASAHV